MFPIKESITRTPWANLGTHRTKMVFRIFPLAPPCHSPRWWRSETNKQRKSLHLPPASPTRCLYLIQRRPKVLTSLVFNTANVYLLRVSDLHRPRCLYLIQRRPKVPTVTSLGFSACLALKRSACSVANSCFICPQPFVSKGFFFRWVCEPLVLISYLISHISL
jgi:hypothetical protein